MICLLPALSWGFARSCLMESCHFSWHMTGGAAHRTDPGQHYWPFLGLGGVWGLSTAVPCVQPGSRQGQVLSGEP